MTEQELIDRFLSSTTFTTEFLNVTFINDRCKSKKYADIEFTSIDLKSEIELWRIEAKVETNQDRHNTVHKIFGELLKETGREVRSNQNVKYGLLISNLDFYRARFSLIEINRFNKFGLLIPVACVFVWNGNEFEKYNWKDLHLEN